MVSDFSECWKLLTYYGFKSHVNVTEGLNFVLEERIKVDKEEAGTRTLNQTHDNFWPNQDKLVKRKLLGKTQKEVHGQINQCQIIMIVSTATKHINDKLCTYYFVFVKLHIHNCFPFSD